MNISNHRNSNRTLLFQRNIFLALSFILSLSLAASTLFLFMKKERIVIVPPVVEKTFWVDHSTVSATYLEQFGNFLGQLLLSKSGKSAALQKDIVLRHTAPEFVGVLEKKLLEEEKTLKKQDFSYVFYSERVEVDQKNTKVFLFGERTVFAQDKKISSEKEGYILGFQYKGSRLLLNSLEKEGKDAKKAL